MEPKRDRECSTEREGHAQTFGGKRNTVLLRNYEKSSVAGEMMGGASIKAAEEQVSEGDGLVNFVGMYGVDIVLRALGSH